MKKNLITDVSGIGTTENIANYWAQGIQMAGNETKFLKISSLEKEADFSGFEEYSFWMPYILKKYSRMYEAVPLFSCKSKQE